MDFDLSPEQLALKRRMAAFATERLNANLIERDHEMRFDRDAWRACAKAGVQGLPFAPEYGGSGADVVSTVAAMEGLGYGCRDSGLIFGINAQMWSVMTPLVEFGTEEQRRRYLPGLIDGSQIGAHGMTEPESGSDAFALSTTAERRGDDYVLNGSKTLITNAPVADVFVVFATVNKGASFMGVTGFILDKDTPGFRIGPAFSKLGLRTAAMGELHFEDCVLPARRRIGREGAGSSIFNASMEWERAAILANYVGAMQYQLERCLAYARDRKQFGRPIAEHSPVAERLVHMKQRLETSRLMIYRVAWLKQTQGKCPLEAAMAKLYVSESWHASCLDAVRIHGGYGFLTGYEIERDLRDSVGGLLYSGTSDIQRSIIGRLAWSAKA